MPTRVSRRAFIGSLVATPLASRLGLSVTRGNTGERGDAAPRQAGERVIVVGAGAFGGWTALALRRAGMRVTLVDGGNLAGSVTALDRELGNVVAAGIPLVAAVKAAAGNPAALLGLEDRGRIAVGLRADLVELDAASLAVRRVMRAGDWIAAA